MDVAIAGFYGVICALLAALAPVFRKLWIRVAIGAVVGVAAAAFLPQVREFIAGY